MKMMEATAKRERDEGEKMSAIIQPVTKFALFLWEIRVGAYHPRWHCNTFGELGGGNSLCLIWKCHMSEWSEEVDMLLETRGNLLCLGSGRACQWPPGGMNGFVKRDCVQCCPVCRTRILCKNGEGYLPWCANPILTYPYS